MKVLRYEDSVDDLSNEGPVIFLAGPTVRAHQTHLESWRNEALCFLNKEGFTGTVIIPEFLVRNESNLEKGLIPVWEFTGLKQAHCILFWVPRTQEMIGLTTNYEMGYWVAKDRDKVVYGRPDDAYRMSYPDIMWKEDAEEGESTCIYTTLENTVKAAIITANKRYCSEPHNYGFYED